MKLCELKNGESAKIIQMENSYAVKRRFEDLGLTEGITVKVIRRAPLNCPIEICVRDFHMAIRVCDAERRGVEKI